MDVCVNAEACTDEVTSVIPELSQNLENKFSIACQVENMTILLDWFAKYNIYVYQYKFFLQSLFRNLH